MGRTLFAAALPAAVVAASWVRLEDPREAVPALVVVVLALVPACVRGTGARIAAIALGAAGAAWVAFGIQPWEVAPFRDEHVVSPLTEDLGRGLSDFYAIVLPFDPVRHPEMEAVLLMAVFGFTCAIGILAAARKPLAAAAVTIAAAGWPATLLGTGGVAAGALALAAALSIPLVLRARTATMLAVGAAIAALVVAGSAWASSVTTFSRAGALDWKSWDFGTTPARALGVKLVWDARYDGIRFPPTKTVVLRIDGPEQAQYWRASTLDTFVHDRWLEDLPVLGLREPTGALPRDALTPPAASDRRTWVEQHVEVRALVDRRLVAAATPTALEARSLGTVFSYAGGLVQATAPIAAGTRYRVWSHVADPSPADLVAAPARYPPAARRYLALWGFAMPPFGKQGRDRMVRGDLADPSYSDFGEYAPVYAAASTVAGRARSPYAAVLALESWFRLRGGFRYDEQPPRAVGAPPLVDFVTRTKAGYCQHYAGAMALMLRFLGVPARVAVGFTSGQLLGDTWVVSDRDAHAWVEAWFPRYGWVPFDPTPGRGTFAGTYSFASDSAAAVDALERGRLETLSGTRQKQLTSAELGAASLSPSGEGPSILLLAAVLAVAAAGVIGAAKWLVRRARYLTIQPRGIAAATRKELEAFVRDQGIPVTASATLEDLRHIVGRELGFDGLAYVDAAARGRFGPPRDTRRAAQTARAELRTLLRNVRGELSPWARFRGFVSLRSLRGWQG